MLEYNAEEKLETYLRTNLPIYEHIGLKIVSASHGEYRCSIPLQKENSNHFGTIHAAIQWASAEVVGGLVFLTAFPPEEKQFLGMVKEFTISFKKPATTSVIAETFFSESELEAVKEAVLKHGRHDFEISCVLRNTDGEIIAEGKGIYAIRKAI